MGRAEHALAWIIGGAVTATIVTTVGPSIVASVAAPPNTILFHYQTLATGLLALASASVATFYLHRQIDVARHQAQLTRQIEDERREGEREAARSWLSLHLSIILGHAEATGKDLWTLIRKCEGGKLPHDTQIPDFKPIPMESAQAVKEFAEFASKDEARYIALLFASMQVLDANVRSLKSSTASHYLDNLESYLIYAGETYARAEALLDYTRLITDRFPKGATWERFRSAMFFMTQTHEPTKRIAAYIQDKSDGDLSSFLPNKFEKT